MNIVDKYSKYVDAPESLEDYYTDAQIQIMLKCIETETFEAPFDAKVNVASVILNRLNRDEFPTDPIKLITDKTLMSVKAEPAGFPPRSLRTIAPPQASAFFIDFDEDAWRSYGNVVLTISKRCRRKNVSLTTHFNSRKNA